MKLYIFKCKTTPKMYGATRYETPSNLPTSSCSAGWEFVERVELTPRGTLRLGVDTAIVRRNVRHRGWHVWQESTGGLRKEPEASTPWREYERPQPEPEAVPFEKFIQDPPKRVPDIPLTPHLPVTPRERWRPSQLDPSVRETELATKAAAPPEPVQRPVEPPPPPPSPPSPPPPVAPPPAPAPPPQVITAAKPTRVIEEVPPPPPRPKVSPPEVKPPEPAKQQPLRHQVVWFDIPVRDIDRAVGFYSAVLGTTLKKEQAGPGAAIAALPHTEGAIGGSLVQNMDAKPSESGLLLYLNANGRLDEALTAVEKHGGRIVAEKHSIAPFGFRAVVIDSEGNRIALHSM